MVDSRQGPLFILKDLITSMLSKPSRSEETLLFAKNFLQHPRMLGSLIPSSRFLIDRLLSRVDWKRARTIVEYGPGVGTFTRPILERLAPDATLITIDTNADFTAYLKADIDDERLIAVTGSAAYQRTRPGGTTPASRPPRTSRSGCA